MERCCTMGDTGYRPPQKQQRRQSIQDALDRVFPPGSHGMSVVQTTSKTLPHFSYLVGINQSKLPLPGSDAMGRPPPFCSSYSSFITSIVSHFSLSFGLYFHSSRSYYNILGAQV